jgi:hypothetical protein
VIPTAEDVRAELARVLTVLAQPWESQVAYLHSLDVVPVGANGRATVDELALDLDTIAPAAYGWEAEGDFTAEELEGVRTLDRTLAAMSGQQHADLWTEQALRVAPEWANVRERARRALASLERSESVAASPATRSPVPTRT